MLDSASDNLFRKEIDVDSRIAPTILPLTGLNAPVCNLRCHATHLSKSVRREESRKPLANGLLSILSFVICNRQEKRRSISSPGGRRSCAQSDPLRIRSPSDSY